MHPTRSWRGDHSVIISMRASLLRPLAFRLSPDVLPGGCQLGSLNMDRLQARKRRPVSVRTEIVQVRADSLQAFMPARRPQVSPFAEIFSLRRLLPPVDPDATPGRGRLGACY